MTISRPARLRNEGTSSFEKVDFLPFRSGGSGTVLSFFPIHDCKKEEQRNMAKKRAKRDIKRYNRFVPVTETASRGTQC
jgi:hypothetical protein